MHTTRNVPSFSNPLVPLNSGTIATRFYEHSSGWQNTRNHQLTRAINTRWQPRRRIPREHLRNIHPKQQHQKETFNICKTIPNSIYTKASSYVHEMMIQLGRSLKSAAECKWRSVNGRNKVRAALYDLLSAHACLLPALCSTRVSSRFFSVVRDFSLSHQCEWRATVLRRFFSLRFVF